MYKRQGLRCTEEKRCNWRYGPRRRKRIKSNACKKCIGPFDIQIDKTALQTRKETETEVTIKTNLKDWGYTCLLYTSYTSTISFSPKISLIPFLGMITGPIDTILNLILFVPLGVFLPFLYKRFYGSSFPTQTLRNPSVFKPYA